MMFGLFRYSLFVVLVGMYVLNVLSISVCVFGSGSLSGMLFVGLCVLVVIDVVLYVSVLIVVLVGL